MEASRECSWVQTYTGSCSVGSNSRVNEVEFVVRDIFTNESVEVRDVRAVVQFSIDVFDGSVREKYYFHVVVRGVPYGPRMEDALDVTSFLHKKTYSDFIESGYNEGVRCAYKELHDLYAKPLEGSGVREVFFRRTSNGTVERKVVGAAGSPAGYREGKYVCEGVLRGGRGREVKERRGTKRKAWSSPSGRNELGELSLCSDDEDVVFVGRRRCKSFSESLSRYRYGEDGEFYFEENILRSEWRGLILIVSLI